LIVGVTTTLGAGSAGEEVCEQLTAAVCADPDTVTGRTSGIAPDWVVKLEPPRFASNSPPVPDEPLSDIEQLTRTDCCGGAGAPSATATLTFPIIR
jgi:hypothetical protein